MLNTRYPNLFLPLEIKNVKLKNRIVKPAQWLVYAESDGSVGDRLVGFYENLAKGGVGLVTVEESICDFPLGASAMPHIRLDDDRFIPGLTRLAKAIHDGNCPAFVQITHAGPAHAPTPDGGPIAPSKLDPPAEPVFAVSRELSVEEIKALVEKFAQAALRVKKAGFDGAEIHMAHYALVNAFLSRVQNKRMDEYGCQSLENRARFSTDILKRVRELCGNDFVLGLRMSAKEWGHELGTTVEEAQSFARMFEAAGADYIQVSAYGYGAFALCALPELVVYPEISPQVREFAQRIPTGALLPEAQKIKQAVKIPVSGVGYLDPDSAESALAQGKVDLVCFGRRLLADPELPNKLAGMNEEEIRPCLRCNVCLSDILLGQPARCRVNPFLGNEKTLIIKPAAKPRRVLIAGAGPAGLEAARVAALRGHHVMLYDQSADLGGLLPMAMFIKGSDFADNLKDILEYYKRELSRLHVEIHLGRKVDQDLIELIAPDVVILATGGKPETIQIEGMGGKNVITTEHLKASAAPFLHLLGSRMLGALSKVFVPVGKRVAVIGGDLSGLETVEFLVKRGREVTLIEEGKAPGLGMPLVWLVRLLPWLAQKKVATHVEAKCERITADGVEIKTADGKSLKISVDTVILVSRYSANEDLLSQVKKHVKDVFVIGDARGAAPGYIQGAIYDGAKIGCEI